MVQPRHPVHGGNGFKQSFRFTLCQHLCCRRTLHTDTHIHGNFAMPCAHQTVRAHQRHGAISAQVQPAVKV